MQRADGKLPRRAYTTGWPRCKWAFRQNVPFVWSTKGSINRLISKIFMPHPTAAPCNQGKQPTSVCPPYNAVVGYHDTEPHCNWGALYKCVVVFAARGNYRQRARAWKPYQRCHWFVNLLCNRRTATQCGSTALRIMTSGAEDNTSDKTLLKFKLWFILLSLLKVSWLSDQTQVLRPSICKWTTSYVLWLHCQKRPLAG